MRTNRFHAKLRHVLLSQEKNYKSQHREKVIKHVQYVACNNYCNITSDTWKSNKNITKNVCLEIDTIACKKRCKLTKKWHREAICDYEKQKISDSKLKDHDEEDYDCKFYNLKVNKK